MTVDVVALRDLLAETWPDANGLPRLLVSAVEQLHQLQQQQQHVQQLAAHWKVCAIHAETDAEKETWIICAEQLQDVLKVQP